MKFWKCPRCKKVEQTEDKLVMLFCLDCEDIDMEEVDEEVWKFIK